jgi:hypothetical protein
LHAVDGTEQVWRLRRHRQHTHGGRQDGHRLAAGRRGCVEITLFRGLSNSTRGTPRWRVLACNTMCYFILVNLEILDKYPALVLHYSEGVLLRFCVIIIYCALN